jgi:hypothetical protein
MKARHLSGGTGFVTGLLIVGFVIVAIALYAVDRAVKARAQARRLRTMTDRLAAATARADKQEERRQADAQAGAALTSVIHAIERPPLRLPDMPSSGAAPDDETPAGSPHAGTPGTPTPPAGTPPAGTPHAGTPGTPTPPAGTPHSAARPRAFREHTGPQERRPAHPGRPSSHVSRHLGTLRAGPDGERHDDDLHTRPIGASADAE